MRYSQGMIIVREKKNEKVIYLFKFFASVIVGYW
jgi:hypothetical protein